MFDTRMPRTPAEYRDPAEQCRALACTTSTPGSAEALLEMADEFDTIAGQIERGERREGE